MEKPRMVTEDEEITGYDCNDSVESLQAKQIVLNNLMNDVCWRIFQTKQLKPDEYKTANLNHFLEATPISPNTLTPIRLSYVHDMDQPDFLLKEYLSGKDSSYDHNLFSTIISEFFIAVDESIPAPSCVVHLFKQFCEQISSSEELRNKFVQLPNSTYWSILKRFLVINQALPLNYLSLIDKNERLQYVSTLLLPTTEPKSIGYHPIFSSPKPKESRTLKGIIGDEDLATVFTLKPNCDFVTALDWVVDGDEDTFFMRRYQLLCYLSKWTGVDYTQIVLSSLTSPTIEKRCVLFSDLAELGYINLQVILSKILTSYPQNAQVVLSSLYSIDPFITTRQIYMLKSLNCEPLHLPLSQQCKECLLLTKQFSTSFQTAEVPSPLHTLLSQHDYYHAISISLSLLHPAIIRTRKDDVLNTLKEVLGIVDLVIQHPRAVNIATCCYALSRQNSDVQIQKYATILLSLLLDGIGNIQGVLSRVKTELNEKSQKVLNSTIEGSLPIVEMIEKQSKNKEIQTLLSPYRGFNEYQLAKLIVSSVFDAFMVSNNISTLTLLMQNLNNLLPTHPLPIYLCDYIVKSTTPLHNLSELINELIHFGGLSLSCVLHHLVQPLLRDVASKKSPEDAKNILMMLTHIMERKDGEEFLWNGRYSKSILVDVIKCADLVNDDVIKDIFPESFGGDFNVVTALARDELLNELKSVNQQKVLSALMWKPNSLLNGSIGGIEELKKCSMTTLSLVLNVVDVEKCVDAILFVTLTHQYNKKEFELLLQWLDPVVFKANKFLLTLCNLMKYLSQTIDSTTQTTLHNFVLNELPNWYHQRTNSTILCSDCVIDGLLLLIKNAFIHHHKVEFTKYVSIIISHGFFTRTETELIVQLMQYSLQNTTDVDDIKLLIDAVQNYLSKYVNDPMSTNDILLFDQLLNVISNTFARFLEYPAVVSSIASFSEFITNSSFTPSLKRYIISHLPQLNILPPKPHSSSCVFTTKQQPTYSNLLSIPRASLQH
ncbi:Uncharacterized protein QTN25_010710 [Entamoeba marina]